MKSFGTLTPLLLIWSCLMACGSASARPSHEYNCETTAGCNLDPRDECGAGSLPRLDGKTWPPVEQKKFIAAAEKGTVAVVWDGPKTRVLDECRLDGKYTEVLGEKLDGRMWATNRVFLRNNEIPDNCRSATHVVAAFAKSPRAFAAILVPLPCPPTTETTPALGCVGKGLTGPQRLEKGMALWKKHPPTREKLTDPALNLEIYSLMPDTYWGNTYASILNRADCALGEQASWVAGQWVTHYSYETNEYVMESRPTPYVPGLSWKGSRHSCKTTPVFLSCFPGIFDPAPASIGCWYPANIYGPRPPMSQ